MLVSGFGVQLLMQKQWKTAALSAGVAVLLVVPSVVYTLTVFAPTDAATFAESQRILAEVRIPHHCRPARWFDWVAGLQVVWMLLGLVLLRKTRLFIPLVVVAGLAVAGTVAVIATENPTLSLMFPWRVTAVLVPVSTAVVFAHGFGVGERKRPTHSSALITIASIHAVCAVGSWLMVYTLGLGYREPQGEVELLAHVAATRQPEHVYLIPTRFPARSKDFTGVYSKTFAAPEAVFSDLARFRLATHARLYADFKAIPYKDADALEWHRRVGNCERWYAETDWDYSGGADELAAEGITHVVVPADKFIVSRRLAVVYEDPTFRVYRVTP
jgi:hypothetical protein